MKSKLDAFSAKVDSIDLSYDKRISELETKNRDEQVGEVVKRIFPSILDAFLPDKIESRVKYLIDRDSADLKQMVRDDLKRLESLMLTSFDPSKSSHNSVEPRRSL